jgi:hypothetical protein
MPMREAERMTTLFRSKIDGKLKAIGFAIPCVAVLSIVTSKGLATPLAWLPAAVTVLVAAVVVWVVLSTYYVFQSDALIAHSGPFSWRIPLKEISSVRESNSVRSGPALSLDRLEIAYHRGRVLLISPADKPGFLAALHRLAPHLRS